MDKKVLVPIDSITFDNTYRSVEESLEYASTCEIEGGAELIFLHVWNVRTSDISKSEDGRMQEMRKKEMETEFNEIKKMCKEKGVENFRTVFREGEKAHEEIVKTAQEENVDLIIMGSGKVRDSSVKGKIGKFVYGSVTENVIHEAPCSILVTKTK